MSVTGGVMWRSGSRRRAARVRGAPDVVSRIPDGQRSRSLAGCAPTAGQQARTGSASGIPGGSACGASCVGSCPGSGRPGCGCGLARCCVFLVPPASPRRCLVQAPRLRLSSPRDLKGHPIPSYEPDRVASRSFTCLFVLIQPYPGRLPISTCGGNAARGNRQPVTSTAAACPPACRASSSRPA
jgi:hypothetical protein